MLAVVFAVAISTAEDVVHAFAVQGYEAEAMGDKLIREDRSVGFDFYEIDSHGGYFGKDSAAEGVCKGEVDIAEVELYAIGGNL